MNKKLDYSGAWAIHDPMMEQLVTDTLQNLSNKIFNFEDTNLFLENYFKWIQSSNKNNFSGLENFKVKSYSNGTTESFDKFYLKNNTRRFRCFPGEYLYHQLAWRNYFPNWKLIDNLDLEPNDALVISLPFSDTGNKHELTDCVMELCSDLKIPVLVDCAFFGICADINFDFSYDCISDITFSLSKTLPVSHFRIGMRLIKVDTDDSLIVSNKANYVNKLGALLGNTLIEKISPDYNWTRWVEQQHIFCDALRIQPSNSVIFGIDKNRFPQYNRGGSTNRLCFAKYLKTGILPN